MVIQLQNIVAIPAIIINIKFEC